MTLIIMFEHCAGSDVLTAVMRSSIFWDITLRNPLKVSSIYGVTFKKILRNCNSTNVEAMKIGTYTAASVEKSR
jgi:hypothetical protein